MRHRRAVGSRSTARPTRGSSGRRLRRSACRSRPDMRGRCPARARTTSGGGRPRRAARSSDVTRIMASRAFGPPGSRRRRETVGDLTAWRSLATRTVVADCQEPRPSLSECGAFWHLPTAAMPRRGGLHQLRRWPVRQPLDWGRERHGPTRRHPGRIRLAGETLGAGPARPCLRDPIRLARTRRPRP